MSHYGKPVRVGTWLYGGTAPTGVRIVESQIAFGSGDEEDPQELRDDRDLNCFYVEWAVAGSTTDWPSCGHGPFQTVAHAESYVTVESNGTVSWRE